MTNGAVFNACTMGQCIFESTSIASGDHSVVRCVRCGMGITLPPIADVSLLYTDRQSQDFQPKTRGLAEIIKSAAFRARARSFLKLASGKPAVIVDYGCGSGLFTKCLAAVSKSRVHGLDFHDVAPAGIGDADYRSFERGSELAGRADLLIASHVLEHSEDPVSLVRQMAMLVRTGGELVLEVPNVNCWGARIFGSSWDGWYLPYHRLHFSRASLKGVIERAGLEVVEERGASVPTMGRTLAKLARRPYRLFFLLLGAALQPLQFAVEKLSGQASALRIVARKSQAPELG